jgi:hypothetical protein
MSALTEQRSIRELSPPDDWRIHPSTEARGSGFQHERRVWGTDDQYSWVTLKIRQHAQDPIKTACRTGFEGSNVSGLNTHLAGLLRSFARNGGPHISFEATRTSSRNTFIEPLSTTPPRSGTDSTWGVTQETDRIGTSVAASEVGEGGIDSSSSADHEEEKAAADAATAA